MVSMEGKVNKMMVELGKALGSLPKKPRPLGGPAGMSLAPWREWVDDKAFGRGSCHDGIRHVDGTFTPTKIKLSVD